MMAKKFDFRGKKYPSLSECYRDNQDNISVTLATVTQRLKLGWSLEEALFEPKQKTGGPSKFGSHVVEGVEYDFLPDIARVYGVPKNNMYKRYSRGARGDELVRPEIRKRDKEVPLESDTLKFYAGGVGYTSKQNACQSLGVKYVTYRSRRRSGNTIEQALGIEPIEDKRSRQAICLDFNGVSWTLKDLSEEFGVPVGTLRNRHRRGATIRQVIGLDPIKRGELKTQDVRGKKRNPIVLTAFGKKYNSYISLADEFELPQYVVRQRIVDYGYSPEEAVTQDGKSKPVTVNGRTYKSSAAAARAHGMSSNLYRKRIDAGFTVQQALGLKAAPYGKFGPEYNGVKYRSFTHLSEDVGIEAGMLRERVRRGLTLEDAVAIGGEKLTGPGRYNETILRRDSELASQAAVFYLVSLKIGSNNYHKIGITTNTVQQRLTGEGHKFVIIREVPGTLLDCFLLEQSILNLLLDERADEITTEQMDGYSEVLKLTPSELVELVEILDDEAAKMRAQQPN